MDGFHAPSVSILTTLEEVRIAENGLRIDSSADREFWVM